MTPELQKLLGIAACIAASGLFLYLFYCGLTKLSGGDDED